MASSDHPRHATIPAPLSFALGYAGPRRLGSEDGSGDAWEGQLRAALERVALWLSARLEPERMLCLVGSLARGADLTVAESMIAHGAVLRAWLPEPLDRFANEQDFPDARERERLGALIADAALVEVRVVSSAPDRRERFAECAAEIVRETEAFLCVRHWEPGNGRGGTEEAVALARSLDRPLIEVRLCREPSAEAEVVFPRDWSPGTAAKSLPFPRPDPRATVAAWKSAASAEAGRTKLLIVRAAAWTVGLQLGATVLAVATFHRPQWELVGLLSKLVVILTAGTISVWSSRREVASRWADGRFMAELQRSWSAVRGLKGPAIWFEEDLPPEFTQLGRDLAILHGLDRGAGAAQDAAAFRLRYASERLAGQRSYASRAGGSARRARTILRTAFQVCIVAALVALLVKLALALAGDSEAWTRLDAICSVVEIIAPALGAAALSFVALLDLAARSQMQSRLGEFLAAQERLLPHATDWAATRQLVVATERRLLGEIKGWYARHAYRSR